MTALTVLPDRLTALSVADLVALPATQLAEIVRNLDELLGWHKQQRAKVDAALDRSYAERIQSARADAGKDFGTVHIDDGGIRITVDLPKRVSWDQTRSSPPSPRRSPLPAKGSRTSSTSTTPSANHGSTTGRRPRDDQFVLLPHREAGQADLPPDHHLRGLSHEHQSGCAAAPARAFAVQRIPSRRHPLPQRRWPQRNCSAGVRDRR